jgi:hypothetical protein
MQKGRDRKHKNQNHARRPLTLTDCITLLLLPPRARRRKFFKNYLPVILYQNPDVKATVEKFKPAPKASPRGDGGAAAAAVWKRGSQQQ